MDRESNKLNRSATVDSDSFNTYPRKKKKQSSDLYAQNLEWNKQYDKTYVLIFTIRILSFM